MKIEKAIEILDDLTKGWPSVRQLDDLEAIKLSIEALKFRKSEKEAGYLDLDDLLPGETPEEP